MIVTLSIIYSVSAILQWYWLRLAYTHERGIYRYTNCDAGNVLSVIWPGINTVLCLIFWTLLYPIQKAPKQPRNYNWFIGKKNK